MSRILVADDEPEIRNSLRRILTGHGFTVDTVQDGVEAVERAQSGEPDLILLDLAMPRMGGLEALRRTKREVPETKVIVVTVHGEDAYRRAAFACGADAFIVKKRLRGELLSTLRRVDERAVRPRQRGAEDAPLTD